jgi:hypothetical protein
MTAMGQADPSAQADAAVAGDVPDDYSTLHCIALRWFVQGDTNADACVAVEYRKAGAADWKPAMNLFRVESAAMEKDAPPEGTTLFAGSIFNLEPGTDYEVKLNLVDPDGGSAEKIIKRTTWAEPVAPAPKRTLHAVPGDGGGSGSADDPFKGLNAARLRPGDLLLLAAGKYDGSYTLPKGTAEAPIVIRGPVEGEAAVIDNGGKGIIIRANRGSHVFLEHLTIQGGGMAMQANGAKNLVVRRCVIRDVDNGIFDDGGAERLFIADNVFTGRVEPGSKPPGEPRAVQLSGSGHVVAYNSCNNWRDAIDTRPPAPRNMDFHNNDVYDLQDDGFELDFSLDNVRVYNNRVTNTSTGISFQPSRGGPNYAIRNVLLMVRGETFKLKLTPTNKKAPDWRVGPHRTSGGVMIHNTAVLPGVPFRVWSNEGPAHYFFLRNNLLVGAVEARNGIDMSMPFRHASMDHDIFVANGLKFFAFMDGERYQSMREFAAKTGMEKHGKLLTSTRGIFVADFKLPQSKDDRYKPDQNVPMIAPRSPAVDAGEVLPTINDGFTGRGPDVGAYERGKDIPHYGPRAMTK